MTITDTGPRRPLEHLTVLDLTIALAGPCRCCTRNSARTRRSW
jgi:hypothetical protein